MKRQLQILKALWLVNWHCIAQMFVLFKKEMNGEKPKTFNHQIITCRYYRTSYDSKIVLVKCNCGKIYFGEETQEMNNVFGERAK